MRRGGLPDGLSTALRAVRLRVRRAMAVVGDLGREVSRESVEDRLPGMSAEVAFYALLSVPSLILAFAAAVGFLADLLGPEVTGDARDAVLRGLGGFIDPETMDRTIEPAVNGLFARGRGGIVSLGVLVGLWSGSRLMKVVVDTLNAAYDIVDRRAFWRRRLVALGLTLWGLLVALVLVPLLVTGRDLTGALADHVPDTVAGLVRGVYLPVTALLAVGALTTIYHWAPNWQTPWRRDVPGAVVAMAIWLLAGVGLRVYFDLGLGGSALGALGAPLVVLLWMYASALALLLGGEVNAVVERSWIRVLAEARIRYPSEPAGARPPDGASGG